MFDSIVNDLFLKNVYYVSTFFFVIQVNKSGEISWGVGGDTYLWRRGDMYRELW